MLKTVAIASLIFSALMAPPTAESSSFTRANSALIQDDKLSSADSYRALLRTVQEDNPEARPPVTKTDIQIVQRARKILYSPAKWNRKDNRQCPGNEKTFSLYCALEEATKQVTGDFKHRGAVMQEARFVIDEIAPNRSKYDHRLMGYNNDPTTTWADVQRFFKLLEARIAKRLGEEGKQ